MQQTNPASEAGMRTYLDHAASTPLKPAVREAMLEYLTDPRLMANPSSAHNDGRYAAAALTSLRAQAAEFFACAPNEVVFNSGGSEGDTQALLGIAWLQERPLHYAISAIEHEAVVETALLLQRQGHRLSRVPVSGDGVVPLEAVESLLANDRPDVLSVMAVNNETGVVQPVREIGARCLEHGVVFHTDAVRAAGHGLDEILRDPSIPLLNCTGHKFGGPRGVGLLVQRYGQLPPLIRGGGQEGGSRAGTENLAGIAGLVRALELATPAEAAGVEDLRHYLEQQLVDRFPFCEIHGKRAPRATHITSVSLQPFSGYKLQRALDERGISVGTGSACHDDGGVTISPVLRAMGVAELLARGTLRISLGWNTQSADLDQLLAALSELLAEDSGRLACDV